MRFLPNAIRWNQEFTALLRDRSGNLLQIISEQMMIVNVPVPEQEMLRKLFRRTNCSATGKICDFTRNMESGTQCQRENLDRADDGLDWDGLWLGAEIVLKLLSP